MSGPSATVRAAGPAPERARASRARASRARASRARASEAVSGRGAGLRARHPGISLALILTVAFMVVLDFSIVNVALASIERELHVGAVAVQWVITGYAVTFGGLLVLGGRLADLYGRRRMFVAGLLLFSAGSLGGGMAPDLVALVAARAIQGIGAAIVAPAALSLITTTIPEGPPRTRALGLYGATASVGFVAGLVLGGFLVQFFDWRAVLWVNVPVGLAAAAASPFLLPRTGASRRIRLDVWGAVLMTGMIALAVYAISEGGSLGWLDWQVLGSFALAGLLGVAFVIVERHHVAPLVPMRIFSMGALRNANVLTVLIGAWSAGELLVLPLYLQLVLHYSPLVTGIAIAPQGVMALIAASRGPRLVRRIGPRAFLASAAAAAAAGLGLLGFSLAIHSYALLAVGFVLAGYGTAAAAFGTTVVATHGVAHGEQGLAGGLINMSRQVGAAIGVAIVAAVIGDTASAGARIGPDSLAVAVVAVAAILAVGLALVGFARRTTSAAGEPIAAGAAIAAGEPIEPVAAGALHHAGHTRGFGSRRFAAVVERPYRSAMCRARRVMRLCTAGSAPEEGRGARSGRSGRVVHLDVHSMSPPLRSPIR